MSKLGDMLIVAVLNVKFLSFKVEHLVQKDMFRSLFLTKHRHMVACRIQMMLKEIFLIVL